jgi:regulator of sirC expression with transglutaminase-like and TPR domain
LSDPRVALEAIGQLPDTEIDIAEAALQLARVDAPRADWQAARQHLSDLARDAVDFAADVPSGNLAAQSASLARLLVSRHRYHGDAETYDDVANANLIRVTERRRGLPVALGVLWLHAARATGWEAHGVDFPSHFLVALQGKGTKMVLDPFGGGASLDARALRALLKQVEGDNAELRPGLLQPMSTRAVLLRLQNNVKVRRLRAGDLPGALTCAEDMLRMAPEQASLWREAALMHQRLNQLASALRCFHRFLALVPEGEPAARARTMMDELRARMN